MTEAEIDIKTTNSNSINSLNLTTVICLILLFLFLILLSAFFSGAETAFSTVKIHKIDKILEKKKLISRRIIKNQISNFETTLSTILIGNNLVNVSSSILFSYLLQSIFNAKNSFLVDFLATFIVTAFLVVAGEILPKIFARKYAEKYLIKIFFLIEIFRYIFFIFTYPLKKFTKKAIITNTESDLKKLINIGFKEGVIDKSEQILVKNALDWDSSKVVSVFTKLKDFTYVNENEEIKEIKKKFLDSGYSRMPVKSKSGKFIGIVLLKNIFLINKNENWQDTIIKIPFISANSLLTIAFEKLRYEKKQMAFITPKNNSRKIIGLVTIEDLLETLVGEIYDEHDDDNEIFHEYNLNKIIFNANLKMVDVLKEIKIKVSPRYFNLTLYQFMEKMTNQKLKKGLIFKTQNYKMEVIFNKINIETKILIEVF